LCAHRCGDDACLRRLLQDGGLRDDDTPALPNVLARVGADIGHVQQPACAAPVVSRDATLSVSTAPSGRAGLMARRANRAGPSISDAGDGSVTANAPSVVAAPARPAITNGYDRELYAARHLIENFFAKIKQFRAIATRYEKTARNFLAAVQLVASVVWLNWRAVESSEGRAFSWVGSCCQIGEAQGRLETRARGPVSRGPMNVVAARQVRFELLEPVIKQNAQPMRRRVRLCQASRACSRKSTAPAV
jgi:transposase